MKIQNNSAPKGSLVIPAKTWKNFVSALEDLIDTVSYDRAKQNDDGTRFTMEDIDKLIQRKSRQKTRASVAAC